jgi:hypothetical protein
LSAGGKVLVNFELRIGKNRRNVWEAVITQLRD